MIVVAIQSEIITEQALGGRIASALLHPGCVGERHRRPVLADCGATPARSDPKALEADALDMWGRIQIPYTEEQMDFLEEAYRYERKAGNRLTPYERRRFFLEPMSFDPITKEEPEDPADKEARANRLFDRSRRGENVEDEQDRHFGGRYGFTPGTRERPTPKEDEKTHPEQIPHSDQDEIDEVFAEMMKDFDLNGGAL